MLTGNFSELHAISNDGLKINSVADVGTFSKCVNYNIKYNIKWWLHNKFSGFTQ